MSEQHAWAERYWREAAELRKAAEIVRDTGLREQLLAFAAEYEAFAQRIASEDAAAIRGAISGAGPSDPPQ